MPDMNGLEVQTRLRRVSPSTRVIVLTAKDDPSVRRKAMNGGASAFYIKGVESGEFLAGVKAAADPINCFHVPVKTSRRSFHRQSPTTKVP
jgi:DNA-binding NarL/FixJ family response regulator